MFRLDDILKATGGRALSSACRRFAGISTDSRTVGRGELFIPLIGERFDGHDFVEAAFERGASGALVKKGRKAPASPDGCAVIEVDDTLRALQDIAHSVRRAHAGLLAIGVTGTNGKTTTKEMLASILSVRGPALKNEGNLNNGIGLPLTLLRLKGAHWAAVIEMGMSGFGEIRRLAEIAEPSVGVITNIGPGHIEMLGSIEGVARAKGEIVEALPEDGKAVLNMDDPYLMGLIEKNAGRAVTFGMKPDAMVSAADVTPAASGVAFRLRTPSGETDIALRALGAHNVYNALAAAAAAWSVGMSAGEIKAGLERFSPVRMRMEVLEVGGAKVINDAYNANPASMAAALTALMSIKDGRRIAVLGDMLELGGSAIKAHQDVGRLAGAGGLSLLVLLGGHAKDVVKGAVEAGMKEEQIVVAEGPEEAASALAERIRKGDHVLVKGSRGMKMEKVIELLGTRRLVA